MKADRLTPTTAILIALVFIGSATLTVAAPLGTAFTYQGRLTDGGNLANGLYQVQFELFDAASNGTLLNSLECDDVDATNGLFTITLDFGSNAFNGAARWLQIGVRKTDSQPFTILFPRQQLSPAPYALFSPIAGGVTNRAITSNMLAIGAVTSSNLAPLSVTSAALDAHLALGGPGKAEGILDLFDGASRIMSLDAEDHRISMYSSIGRATTVLSGGNLFLDTGFSNSSTGARLSANGGFGGFLSLNNSNGQPRAFLSGTNTGGLLNLFAANGTNTIGLDGAGQMSLFRNTDGARSIHLFDFGGGALRLNGNNGQQRALLYGANAGGSMQLHNSSNALSVDVRSQFSAGNTAAWVGLNDNGAEKISLAARNGSTGAGGLIGVRNRSGVATMLLTGDNGGADPVLSLQDSANNNGVRLYTSSGFSGLELRTGGTLRANLVADAFSGGLICYNAAGTGSIFLDGSIGKTITKVLQITGGSDLSEQFDVQTSERPLEPGMVVCIDSEHPGQLVVSTKAYDRSVAGIVSGAGGVSPGMVMGQQGTVADGKHPVALTGRVYCLADASDGAIRPGDLLTTSETPGHAMKVANHAKSHGAILGKAMTGLASGKGLVLVLVSLQ